MRNSAGSGLLHVRNEHARRACDYRGDRPLLWACSVTVWGIMNSFINTSKQHMTNLAVMAPGIAEALLATTKRLLSCVQGLTLSF
jgi:hypothetical protein